MVVTEETRRKKSVNSRRLWASRTPEQLLDLRSKISRANQWRSAEAELERRRKISEARKARWDETTAEERAEFGRRVSEGHQRRRFRKRGWEPF